MLQVAHNYEERDQRVVLVKSSVDTKGDDQIVSRLGVTRRADLLLTPGQDLRAALQALSAQRSDLNVGVACVLIDEAQFLTQNQVIQLGKVVDELDIPVLAFGIRTDFQGNLFEGSKYLLAWADNLKEIKTVCHCGRKATMVLRLNAKGEVVSDGTQIEIGGEEKYVSVCRKHFIEKNIG